MRHLSVCVIAALAALAGGCSDGSTLRAQASVRPTYDKSTGRLTRLTLDSDHDGRADTWTDMDGARPLQTRIDRNNDGKVDRWEYYDSAGTLVKVGFSQADNGKPDGWAFSGPDGQIARIEISSAGDDSKINRWEHYDRAG